MHRCLHCNSKLKKNTKFCSECGMTVTWVEADVSTSEQNTVNKAIPIIGLMLVLAAVIAFFVFDGMDFLNKTIASSEITPTETTLSAIAFSDDPTAISAASQSVVKLNCYNKNGELYATGSGFACFADDVIVTNYHVIEGSVYSIEACCENGRKFDVSYVLAVDEDKDIAILGTFSSHNLTLLQPGDNNLQKGEKVVAIGSPLGLLNSVSTGVFSGYVNENNMNVLQFTASISSGSSGGALFNNVGEVLGITFASYEAGQNLNLAIPIDQVERIWNACKNKEKEKISDIYNNNPLNRNPLEGLNESEIHFWTDLQGTWKYDAKDIDTIQYMTFDGNVFYHERIHNSRTTQYSTSKEYYYGYYTIEGNTIVITILEYERYTDDILVSTTPYSSSHSWQPTIFTEKMMQFDWCYPPFYKQ